MGTIYCHVIERAKKSIKAKNLDAFAASEFILKLFPEKSLNSIMNDLVSI